METGELLRNLREIVREETAVATERLANRMDARFDQVNTWIDANSDIFELKQQIATLTDRVAALETR